MTLSKKLLALALLGLILISCNFPLIRGQAQPTATKISDAELLATAVAGTVQAIGIPTQGAQPTEIPPTAAPTQPVIPTATLGAVLPTTAATARACNQAEFVSETVPDGTDFNFNESFTKSWTFKNTGTCTWNTNYKLIYASGNQMGGPAAVNLTQSVAPDGTVTVSVPLKAPGTEGTFSGSWSLQAEDGSVFFSGNTVKIDVTAQAFRVSAVVTDLEDHEPDACPYDNDYTISFTATDAGKITYYVSDSAGATSATKSLTFDKAGTRDASFTWTINDSGAYWIKVYVDSPNHQWFGPFKFDITCP
jgi:hypothetical protein